MRKDIQIQDSQRMRLGPFNVPEALRVERGPSWLLGLQSPPALIVNASNEGGRVFEVIGMAYSYRSHSETRRTGRIES